MMFMVAPKVIHLLSEILGEEEEGITEQTEFTKEYRIEPIDVAKLVIAAEKEFDIAIPDDEAASFLSVGDVVKYVNRVFDNY